jgi:hypothetical protein
MKHLRITDNHELILNGEENKIVYNETNLLVYVDKIKFVDLGLPSGTKWATTNIGAEKPEDFGLYFAWGETEGYDKDDKERSFFWSYYKLCSLGNSDSLTKYNLTPEYGVVDYLTTLELIDDAAYQYDNSYVMPSSSDCDELKKNTTQVIDEVNGVKCLKIIGGNGNYIHMPLGGIKTGTSVENTGYGYYWTKTTSSDSRESVHMMLNYPNYILYNDVDARYKGMLIRPIKK